MKKKSKDNRSLLFIVVCTAIVCFPIVRSGAFDAPKGTGFPASLLYFLWQLLLLTVAGYVQTVFHEGGHLLAGLLTGYRFLSFRIGRLTLVKTHEGFSFRRYSLAGTGGQCLMRPPEKRPDGSYPYRFYHFGGVLLNLLTAAMFYLLYFVCHVYFFLYLASTGLVHALLNGIPMRVQGIATDGYNCIHTAKDPIAREAMWRQLRINEEGSEGVRLKDMPEEWFTLPEEADKSNEIISTIAVLAENRAMDAQDFEKVKESIATLTSDYTILGLHKNLLLMDKITIDLIEQRENADLSALGEKEVKKFRLSMAKSLSVLRTEYAIRLLKEKDHIEAGKIRERFEAAARSHPVKVDAESEQELISYITSLT